MNFYYIQSVEDMQPQAFKIEDSKKLEVPIIEYNRNPYT